jgi:hypothetical protein
LAKTGSSTHEILLRTRKIFVRALTAAGRSARKHRSRFGTEITHCRRGLIYRVGGMESRNAPDAATDMVTLVIYFSLAPSC